MEYSGLDHQNVEDIVALTPLQEGLLFHYLKNKDHNYYLEQLALELSGQINAMLMSKAWSHVIKENEMLRTLYRWEKVKKPVQIVLKESYLKVRIDDLIGLDEKKQLKKISLIKVQEKEQINLATNPFRIRIIKLAMDKCVLMITNHHILYDGWSNGIILQEFIRSYYSLCMGTPLKESIKPEFKEFVKLLQKRNREKEKKYWASYLKGFEGITKLSGSPAIKKTQKGSVNYALHLSNQLTTQISNFVKKNEITTATFFYTIWAILLKKYANVDDLVFGTTVSGRNVDLVGIEKMVGLFINTIPLRFKADANKSITQVFKQIDQIIKERNIYENVPLVDIKSYSQLSGRESLFDTIVVIENYPLDRKAISEYNILNLESYATTGGTNYDLTLTVESRDQIAIDFAYNPAKFDSQFIERLTNHFTNILTSVLVSPDSKLAKLEMLTFEEKVQILKEFNHTQSNDQQFSTITKLFEEQTNRTPDQTALVYNQSNFTYQELNQKANQLAQKLRQLGLKPDQVVGIMVNPSLEMVVGLLGILKGGGAYLPIDPNYPNQRIEYMLQDTSAEILLVDRVLLDRVKSLNYSGQALFLDDPQNYTNQVENLSIVNQPEDLAYIIYTSGSTGQPKGVMVEHRNVANLLSWFGRQYNLSPGFKVLQMTNITFDPSVEQIFGTLTHGGILYLMNRSLLAEKNKFYQFIEENQIQMINFIPTVLKDLLINQKKISSLEIVISGGEKLDKKTKDAILKKGYKLFNHYGPTETTIDAVTDMCSVGPVLLGKPISNLRCYIIDSDSNLMPIGITGELCVSGAGVTRGYINSSEFLDEKFVEDPFCSGKRMYKTGDLAKWWPDGRIEFVGRIDHQVKIRGFRIELEEVENRLLEYPEIVEIAVKVWQDANQDQLLCCYYVLEEANKTSQDVHQRLKEFLRERLPDHMIPVHFIQLPEMPLTKNGKIDRKALPEINEKIHKLDNYVAPQNRIEAKLVMIWSEILQIDQIGIYDDFFDLGGHSLKATQLMAQIYKTFNREISLHEIFQTATIAGLAEKIRVGQERIYASIQSVEVRDYYPLSSAQKRLFVLDQMDSTRLSYNMPGVMEITRKLDEERFDQALQALVARHEALRTSFELVEGEPVQRIHDQVQIDWSYRRITEKRSVEELAEEFVRAFDLGQVPLLRMELVDLQGQIYLFFDMHHIISDGVSMDVLIRDFGQLYQGKELPKLRIQYKDIAIWQNQLFQSGQIAEQREYWLNRFADQVPVLNLPTDYPRPMTQVSIGEEVRFQVEKDLLDRLNQLAKEQGVTLYMLLLATYNIFLFNYTGQEDLNIGSPISGRNHSDFEKVIGVFVNTLAMRNQPVGSKSFSAFLATVRENALQAYENQDYQFEKLVEELSLKRDLSRNPLFDVMFNLQQKDQEDIVYGDLKLIPYGYEYQTAKFDLSLNCIARSDQLEFIFYYRKALFKRERIKKMADHFVHLLWEIVRKPAAKIKELQILSSVEREEMIFNRNATDRDLTNIQTIVPFFEKQVAICPEQLAVIARNGSLTYRELNERSNQLAHQLKSKGVGRDQIIGLMCDRSLETLVGIIGILKAGGAYLPLSSDFPVERIEYILHKSQAQFVLMNQVEKITLPNFTGEMVDLQDSQLIHESRMNLPAQATAEDLAYVIYTSGTTGNPKGVMIDQRSVINLVVGLYEDIYQEYQSGQRVALVASYLFDASVKQIFAALLLGHSLYIVPEYTKKEGRALLNYYQEHQIEITDGTPAHLALLSNALHSKERISLKHLIIGGEALSGQVVYAFLQKIACESQALKLTNIYGPAECCVDTISFLVDLQKTDHQQWKEFNTLPIGKALMNKWVYILNRYGKLVPDGVVGEIYISGEGLARGYLGESELTNEKFLPNPFVPSKRMYKTGDLGRWLSDGNLEFVGRRDHQVKVRGYRIELAEIEAKLRENPLVDQVIVLDGIDDQGIKYLITYLTADQPISISELKSSLAKQLPDYMIPAYFIQLSEMPLTRNGKIDRQALPKLEEGILRLDNYVAPRNLTEAKLARIWSEILKIDPIGIYEDFFELGGHSLNATRLMTQIYQTFNREISLSDIFQTSTIAGLAEKISAGQEQIYASIQVAEKREVYPLSSAQKRLFILNQMEPTSLRYNMPGVMKISGKLDVERLDQALQALVVRHEALRTTFELVDGEPVQRIQNQVQIDWSYRQLSDKRSIEELVKEFVRSFDLGQVPLLRMELVELQGQIYLFFDMHHIISDGVSMDILIRDISQLYQGKELPELRIQYKDIAIWQNQLFQSDQIVEQREYWLNRFADQIPVLNLPTDYPRGVVLSSQGGQVQFTLPKEEIADLKKLASEQGVTLYMLLLAAWNVLLARYSGQEDIIIGSPIAGRNHPDFDDLLGVFVNTLAMRNQPVADKIFTDFLKEVRENALMGYEYQDFQFEMLVEELHLERDLARNPLFDVLFTMQKKEKQFFNMGDVELIPYSLENTTAKFDLHLYVLQQREDLNFNLSYSADLFQEKTIQRLAGHWRKLLQNLIQNPKQKVGEIELISKMEKEQILRYFNYTEQVFLNNQTLMEIFEKKVGQRPQDVAVVFGEIQVSYEELNMQANCLARLLRRKGVGSNQVVGIMMKRSLEMLVSLLGILKAGGAYLPIDPNYPTERIQYLLTDSQAQILLVDGESGKFNDVEIVQLSQVDLTKEEVMNLTLPNQPGNLAYIIYTSGSTGRPKGVMVEHSSVVNILSDLAQKYPLAVEDGILLKTTFTFDVSVTELFGWFFGEGRLVILEEGGEKDPRVIFQTILEQKVTHVNFVPSMLQSFFDLLHEDEFKKLVQLKYILVAGEVLSNDLVRRFYRLVSGVALENLYGPTEATIYATSCSLPESSAQSRISIGKPVANSKVYILNSFGQLQPIGVPGELCIGGIGLARGYLNQPELTQEKFIENPLRSGELIYRSGDLGKWLPDGNIEFLGRIDHQVKIRGYRIELGEIENHLLQHPLIKEVVVTSQPDGLGNQDLVGYLIPENVDQELKIPGVRDFLKKSLPEYMVPFYFIQVDQFPYTSSGKLDIATLKKQQGKKVTNDHYIAPRTEVEKRLEMIWRELLGIEEISMNDHFFQLGGHSLKATALVTRIHQLFDVEMPLMQVFKNPTLEAMAQKIESATISKYNSIQPVVTANDYPLSSAQKRMFFIHQMNDESLAYNMPLVLVVDGEIDLHRLEAAFTMLIERHEILRSSFFYQEGEARQRVYDQVDLSLTVREIQDQEIDLAIQTFIQPFDLSKPPLIRMGVFRNQDNDQWLLVDLHHIVSDGRSIQILIDEFLALYQGDKLPALRIQYKDFAVWQQKMLYTSKLEVQKQYWLERLADTSPELNLAYDHPEPEEFTFVGSSVKKVLAQQVVTSLRGLAQKQNVTLYMLLLAAYNVLLYRYTGQEDLFIGTPVAGRDHLDLENVIGVFVNTLVMRNHPTGEKSFVEFLSEVRKSALEAYQNQDYQFDDLVIGLNLTSGQKLFKTMFVLQEVAIEKIQSPNLTLIPYQIPFKTVKFDLHFTVSQDQGDLILIMDYSLDRFENRTVERMLENYRSILEQMLEQPTLLLKDFQLKGDVLVETVAEIDQVDFGF